MDVPLHTLSIYKGQLNQLRDREAMGLPNHYVSTRLENSENSLNRLKGMAASELIHILEDRDEDLITRYAAGTMLALLDDPRIDPFNPSMVAVPGSKVKLGLEPSQVTEVLERYEETGIIEEWIVKETPVYEAEIPSFKIGQYPVTNKEYLLFIKENLDAEIPTSWKFGRYPIEFSNHPVYTVSPETADAYASWLSKKTNRKFRLPTEEEWEYAAAGPERNEFPWGNEFLKDHANTVETGFLSSSPVGMFPEGCSIFGIDDLAGNVEEYVADDYRPYPGGEEVADDLINSVGTYRIARGGSFTRFKDLARCKRRHGRFPRDIYVMGFRLVEDN